MSIPLSQLDNSLDRLAKKIVKEPKDWVKFASNEAYGIFTDRLFNDRGSRAKNGSLLPRYSPKYLAKNEFGKRKVASTWDLIASGDLFGSIKENIQKDSATIEFVDADEIKKAENLEKRAGKVIFEFSKAEMKEVIDKTVKEIRKDILKMVKESFK